MPRPLRFLHITTFYPPYSFGGDAIAVYRLCHALAEEGHQVDVIHCRDAFHLFHRGSPELHFDEHPRVDRHGLQKNRLLSPLISHLAGKPGFKNSQIRKIVKGRHFDVVHYHNISLFGPDILRLPFESCNPLRLYTTHEHWLICPMHALWKNRSRPCDKPDCLMCTLRGSRPPQLWRYTRLLQRACRSVDRFFAPSHFAARMHAQRGFGQPMTVLPDFTVEDQQPRALEPPHTRPFFLYAGRLESLKGAQDLVRIWSQIQDADLLIAGAGGYKPELERQAAANPSVHFLGNVAPDQLADYYFHALACLVPSLTYETFGIVVIEAFSNRTPVIVRNLGSLPELVEQSAGGLLFSSDEELVNRIRQILDSRELRHSLGENGYRAFRSRWSQQAHLKLYFEQLEELAQSKYGSLPWAQEGSRTRGQLGSATRRLQ